MLPFRRILFPTDFSRCSLDALPMAVEMARGSGAETLLLHVLPGEPGTPWDVPPYADFGLAVMPPQDYGARLEDEVDRRLHALVKETFPESAAVRILVRKGDAARAIVDAATEDGADLIVMATHGWTGWRHFVFGSVAERVLREAQCPVMVLKSAERPAEVGVSREREA